MIGLMEPLAGPGKRVSNGVQFQGFFGVFATADFEASVVGRGVR